MANDPAEGRLSEISIDWGGSLGATRTAAFSSQLADASALPRIVNWLRRARSAANSVIRASSVSGPTINLATAGRRIVSARIPRPTTEISVAATLSRVAAGTSRIRSITRSLPRFCSSFNGSSCSSRGCRILMTLEQRVRDLEAFSHGRHVLVPGCCVLSRHRNHVASKPDWARRARRTSGFAPSTVPHQLPDSA